MDDTVELQSIANAYSHFKLDLYVHVNVNMYIRDVHFDFIHVNPAWLGESMAKAVHEGA